MNLSSQVLIAFQRSRHQVADAGEEVDAHARVESIRIVAADSEESQLGLVTERDSALR